MSDGGWSDILERSDAALVAMGFSDDWTDETRTRYVKTPTTTDFGSKYGCTGLARQGV
jgi:hypothetical protein